MKKSTVMGIMGVALIIVVVIAYGLAAYSSFCRGENCSIYPIAATATSGTFYATMGAVIAASIGVTPKNGSVRSSVFGTGQSKVAANGVSGKEKKLLDGLALVFFIVWVILGVPSVIIAWWSPAIDLFGIISTAFAGTIVGAIYANFGLRPPG